MPRSGIVVKFNREKGFGFIRFSRDEPDAFVHVADVEGRVDLVPGQNVECEVVETAKGPSAKNVKPGSVASSAFAVYVLAAILLIAAATAGAMYFKIRPAIAVLIGVNVATTLLYGYDKAIAGGRKRRCPESVLLLLVFFGGTLAALGSSVLFRHKTSKRSFLARFWLVVLLQVGVLAAWAWLYDHCPSWMPESLRFLFRRP